ncbi:hypothetical protein QO002_000905 [Pararhizobium capsulatum DSM 1112]|uniref:Uncharacterized protein n=1 Tax=Pararhizobium capsulatum DSM 1112 TaxID=1121113 RepID=A0ABU0BL79_9HYPH|nr:hypothetical protein [Pararhizobium capsulatum DSM 1112]
MIWGRCEFSSLSFQQKQAFLVICDCLKCQDGASCLLAKRIIDGQIGPLELSKAPLLSSVLQCQTDRFHSKRAVPALEAAAG